MEEVISTKILQPSFHAADSESNLVPGTQEKGSARLGLSTGTPSLPMRYIMADTNGHKRPGGVDLRCYGAGSKTPVSLLAPGSSALALLCRRNAADRADLAATFRDAGGHAACTLCRSLSATEKWDRMELKAGARHVDNQQGGRGEHEAGRHRWWSKPVEACHCDNRPTATTDRIAANSTCSVITRRRAWRRRAAKSSAG